MNKNQRQRNDSKLQRKRVNTKPVQTERLSPTETWNYYADRGLVARLLAYIWAGIRL